MEYFWLTDVPMTEAPSGTVLFGGIDDTKYQGPLISVPLVPNPVQPDFPFYAAQLTDVSAQSPEGTTSLTAPTWDQNDPIYAVLDSGSTDMMLPADAASALYSYVGATLVTTEESTEAMVPCNLTTAELVFTFTFGGPGGPRINVPISDLISPRTVGSAGDNYTDGTPACSLAVSSGSDYTIILGDVFLRSAYVVYDPDNQQVALAQSNLTSTAESNVQEILPGPNGIPGVVASMPILPWNIPLLRAQSTVQPPTQTLTATASVFPMKASVTAQGPPGALWSGSGVAIPTERYGSPARTATGSLPTLTAVGRRNVIPLRRRIPSQASTPTPSPSKNAAPGRRMGIATMGLAVLGVCVLIVL